MRVQCIHRCRLALRCRADSPEPASAGPAGPGAPGAAVDPVVPRAAAAGSLLLLEAAICSSPNTLGTEAERARHSEQRYIAHINASMTATVNQGLQHCTERTSRRSRFGNCAPCA